MLAAIGSQRIRGQGVIAFLLAITFLVQSYLIQSHVHPTFGQHDTLSWSTGSAGDNPADCPLCQADLLAGVYIAPSPPEIGGLPAYAWTKPLVSASRLYSTQRKHSWQGRAPPLS
jgi:hypothetical protein